MLVFATNRLIHFVCAALSIKSCIESKVLRKPQKKKEKVRHEMVKWERAESTCARHSRLQLTDVLQQRLRRIFPLSLHAPSEVREQARSPLRKPDAVLLISFDVLAFV